MREMWCGAARSCFGSSRARGLSFLVVTRFPPAILDRMYIWMYTSSMPKSYTVASARAKLAAIVDEVESGKDVELTRRGKKVAVVMSAARYARLRGDRVAFMTAYETFRAEHDLEEVGLDPTWARELRDRDPGRGVKL